MFPSKLIICLAFALEAFASLHELTLNGVPPSTITDFYSLRSKLVRLEILNAGIPDLVKVLAPIKKKYLRVLKPMILIGESPEIKKSHQWQLITHLTLSNCGITKLDASLHMLPCLEVLDISHNDISHIIHLQDCLSLRVVNAAYNRVSVLSNIGWVIANVQILNLSHNKLQSLDGIERLPLLRKLDLSYNSIRDINEVKATVDMKELVSLVVFGNPCSISPNYRLYVFSLFLQACSLDGRRLPALDGQRITSRESHAIK
jgi:Leucine-rich repeat (LRR) protein